MDFPGTDEPSESQRPPRRPRAQRFQPASPDPPRRPRGDLWRRRLIALLVGAVVILLLFLLLRSCQSARQERSFQNYLRDLSSIAATSQQLSSTFFTLLRNPGDASPLEFTRQVGTARGTSEDLLRRVEGLDAPDELAGAQEDLVTAFELRRDALADFVERIDGALGEGNRLDAIAGLAADMRALLASDVLYGRAELEIEAVVAEEEVEVDSDDPVPPSQFLPEPPEQYIDATQLAGLLAAVAADTGAATGTHDTEIASSVLRPGEVALDPEALTTFSARGAPQLEVSVLNAGEADERDVVVSYELSGALVPLAGRATIPRIAPGQTGTALLPIEGEVPRNQELTLRVGVLPVPGETVVDDNESVYPVVFG